MALLELPNELLCMIADYCNDRSLCNFSAASRGLHHLLTSNRGEVWRNRFRRFFDDCGQRRDYRQAYIKRMSVTKEKYWRGRYLVFARTVAPSTLLEIVREANVTRLGARSRNMMHLHRKLTLWRQLEHVGDIAWPFSCRTLDLLHLLFFHLVVGADTRRPYHDFAMAQRIAYGNPITYALFTITGGFNLDAMMHLYNFFIAHICSADFGTTLQSLELTQRPRPWVWSLTKQQRPLGAMWTGLSFKPLSTKDSLLVRMGQNQCLLVNDRLVDQPVFDHLDFSFEDAHVAGLVWPEELRRILGIAPPQLQFVGNAEFRERALLVAGVLQPVDGLRGIEGWQRVCFVAYEDPAPETSGNMAIFDLLAADNKVPLGREPALGHELLCEMEIADIIQAAHPCGRKQSLDAVFLQSHQSRHDYRAFLREIHSEGRAQPAFRPPNLAADARPRNDEVTLAFEGLVWPGGNVMMGRWWVVSAAEWENRGAGRGPGRAARAGLSKDEQRQQLEWRPLTGPWVAWCVDSPFQWQGSGDDDDSGGEGSPTEEL